MNTFSVTNMGCLKLTYHTTGGSLDVTAENFLRVIGKKGQAEKKRIDYYPFGMTLPGRNYNQNDYKYGFQGQENDNEISGSGNSQDHMFRQYDTRIGRYRSLDPLFADFSWNSPYAYAENRVIDGFDLEGREFENFKSTFIKAEDMETKLPNINAGEIQEQVYKVAVSSSNMSIKGFKNLLINTPEKILSNSKATFKPIPKESQDRFKLEVGANIRINISGPMNNSFVRVTDVTSSDSKVSTSFTTLEGHVEAGVITFSVEDLGNDNLEFTIHGISQTDYGALENVLTSWMFDQDDARESQAASWFEVLQNFIDVSGGDEESRIVTIKSKEKLDGGIKEVSISRKVNKGDKDFEKQASTAIEAITQKKEGR